MAILTHLMKQDVLELLEQRLGRLYTHKRLAIETDGREQAFDAGRSFFLLENWDSADSFIRNTLKIFGLYSRGLKNSERVELRRNSLRLAGLPAGFAGFTILHISDMHVDMNPGAMLRLAELLANVKHDICVLTGDYRGRTFGSFEETLEGMARIRPYLGETVYGVLGNPDSIRMVPALEALDIRMLINESVTVRRGDSHIHLSGIDDAHYFRADNIEKASADIPRQDFSVLLSHTPEIYLGAANADFNLLLSGHTHGGQICLPGRIPLTLDSKLPRSMGWGPWVYRNLTGYTSAGVGSSIVPVRFNCPPEITLHHLHPA